MWHTLLMRWVWHSLVPRPPPFLPSVCNTWERKTGEKQGRPGSIHHMSGREVDVGGRDRYSNVYVANLKASFLPLKTSSFYHAKVWSLKRGRVLEWMVLCVVLAVGPLPPYIHLVST